MPHRKQKEATQIITKVTYSLWDPNQKPAYEACAAEFKKKSGISVDIQQTGWDDYWKNLTVPVSSDEAPDVITNHVAQYPELAAKGVLTDLKPYIQKDKIDMSQYTGDWRPYGITKIKLLGFRKTGTL